jgi:hypothetical protein
MLHGTRPAAHSCYVLNMPDRPPAPARRRFPAPWCAAETPGGYAVETADGRQVAYVYGRDDLAKTEWHCMTEDEARCRLGRNNVNSHYIRNSNEFSALAARVTGGIHGKAVWG